MHLNSDRHFSAKAICRALIEKGLISVDQAKDLLGRAHDIKKKLAEKAAGKASGNIPDALNAVSFIDVLVYLNLNRLDEPDKVIDEDLIFKTLADSWHLPYKKIDPLKLELNLVTGTISRSFALRHLLLPLHMKGGKLVVATPNPFNHEAIDDVQRVTNLKVSPIVSSKTDVARLIKEFFGFHHSISAAENLFSRTGVDLGNLERSVNLGNMDEPPSTDQHIVNAVNHLFSYAFDQKASDVHIEPKRDICLVRMRIDGALHTVYKLPKKLHNAVISRIKNLSALDMAEKRRPQDGRIKMLKKDLEVELRVSTIPVAFGEKVVMRIMDPEILFQDLESLGFSPSELKKYKNLITMPFGIVLVTGPTGSGKSTTLYSSLRMVSSPEVNITTIEDPIEMIHEEFNQIGVQQAIDVTFGSVLRNIMRQDPDIIMVGEIRDLETAQAAVQAALTGHLVLSTLHTNDAVSTVFRLLDLGIPPYLIHSALTGVVAQRLVRKICPHCAQTFEMDRRELADLGLVVPGEGPLKLRHGKGCVKCRNTGYRGRTGIYEILAYTRELKQLTTGQANLGDMRQAARKQGLKSLRENGIVKMLEGRTTYQEILRVTWEQA